MVTSFELVPASPRLAEDDDPPHYTGENVQSEPTEGPDAAADFDEPPVTAPQPVPDIPRCNLLNISRPDGRIAGQYVVDPSVSVSDSLLVPLLPEDLSGGARPNLRLATSKDIEAEAWVLDSEATAVRLVFISKRGHVRVRLHGLGNKPCIVAVRAAGNARVTLPCDFVGTVLTSTTRAPVAIPASFATLSEVEGDGKYFKGPLSHVGASGWHGTSVDIQAPVGKITVLLAENPEAPCCIISRYKL